MKKLSCMIGLVLGLFFTIQPLWAQTTSVGLRGGVNLARWYWEDDAEIDKDAIKDLPGLIVAVPFEVSVFNNFAVQPELSFVRKGVRLQTEESGEGGYFKVDAQTKLDYLALDLLFKGKFGNDAFQVYVIGGPGMSYATHGKISAEITLGTDTLTTTEEETEDIDFEDAELSRLDLSLLFGGGVEIPLGIGRIVLDARYNLGINNLNTDNDPLADDKLFNRGIMFSAGFMIPIGK